MSLLFPNQPFFSLGQLCIHRGRGSCPELDIIFVLLMIKMERYFTWVWKLGGLSWYLYHLKAHLAQTDQFTRADKKNSEALWGVSISMHERQRTSWCVRWHSKQDHCTAASAEQNNYFLLLHSAYELKPQDRLVSVVGREKEAQTCFHAL